MRLVEWYKVAIGKTKASVVFEKNSGAPVEAKFCSMLSYNGECDFYFSDMHGAHDWVSLHCVSIENFCKECFCEKK